MLVPVARGRIRNSIQDRATHCESLSCLINVQAIDVGRVVPLSDSEVMEDVEEGLSDARAQCGVKAAIRELSRA